MSREGSRPDDGARDADGASLERWLARIQVDDAARARARRHWLRAAAEEAASLAGVVLDLAERGVDVTLTTTAPRRHHGVIALVGADFVALRATSGRYVLVRRSTVATVRPSPGQVGPIGDRDVASNGTLVDVLVALAAERLPATLLVGTSESLTGELRSVGQDVVVVRMDGDPPSTVYVATDRVDEVALDGPPSQSLTFESG